MKTRARGTDQFFIFGAHVREPNPAGVAGLSCPVFIQPDRKGLLKDTVVFSQYKFECPSRPSLGGRADLMILPRIKKPYHQGHGQWYCASAASYRYYTNVWEVGKSEITFNYQFRKKAIFTFII